jgi:acyl carrier protein
MIDSAELLELFQDHYRRARGTRRDIRLADRLVDDLDVDSLFVTELLVALEDRSGLRLLDEPRVWKVGTVGEFVALMRGLDLERQMCPVRAAA